MAKRAELVADAARERAVSLYTHYVTLLMGKQGLTVDMDTLAECRDCIEAIITAAVATVEAAHPNVF